MREHGGGEIVAAGTPEDVAMESAAATGQYLESYALLAR